QARGARPGTISSIPGQRSGVEGRELGDQGVRLHNLRTQIRSDSPGRDGGPQIFPNSDHVSCPDVFGIPGRCGRQRRGWWWRQYWLVSCFLFVFIGCKPGLQPATAYAAARQQLTQGFFDDALRKANEGYQYAEHRDALWAWKFRGLQAEVYLRQGSPQRTI